MNIIKYYIKNINKYYLFIYNTYNCYIIIFFIDNKIVEIIKIVNYYINNLINDRISISKKKIININNFNKFNLIKRKYYYVTIILINILSKKNKKLSKYKNKNYFLYLDEIYSLIYDEYILFKSFFDFSNENNFNKENFKKLNNYNNGIFKKLNYCYNKINSKYYSNEIFIRIISIVSRYGLYNLIKLKVNIISYENFNNLIFIYKVNYFKNLFIKINNLFEFYFIYFEKYNNLFEKIFFNLKIKNSIT